MADSPMGLLQALGMQLTGADDWYLPAPYELPLGANITGGPRIPPGSEYSPSRRRWERPDGRRFDAPAPTMGSIKWLASAVYPELMYQGCNRAILSKNKGVRRGIMSKDSAQAPKALKQFRLGHLGTLNQVIVALGKTIRAMADGSVDSQVGSRIANGLGIMRQCLETRTLDQLGERLEQLENTGGTSHGTKHDQPTHIAH